VSLQVVAGSKGPQLADLELEIEGVVRDAQARGNGPIDAAFNAIRKLVPHSAKLQLYQVSCGDRRDGCPGRSHGSAR